MMQTCALTGKPFEITAEDLVFYEKMGVLPPTLCPEERARRRMAWSNQRNLYHRTCDGTGKKIISNISSDKPLKVYDVNFWYSDKWDQLGSGRDFDFSRPFFEQFGELLLQAPIPSLFRSPGFDENSEYTNHAGKNKNCYLIFDSDQCHDVYYSQSVNACRDISDCFRAGNCELSYQLIDCMKCYGSAFLQDCDNCSESFFLKNCIGCQNCFGCINLRNKKYYFFNKPLSKEVYEKTLRELGKEQFSKLSHIQNHFFDWAKQFPQKFMMGVNNEDVIGNYLSHCKNAEYCFDSRNLWDCKYIQQGFEDAKNCMDCSEVGDGAELLYECNGVGYGAQNNCFVSNALSKVNNSTYSFHIPFSSDLFGCVGLHHQQYCILNKRYSKDEYFALKTKIIEHMKKAGEWGEFFPISLSPFGYNETVAQDYFPMTKEEIMKRGWKGKDEEESAKYEGPKVQIPSTIGETQDSICDQILECEQCAKNYRIAKPELKFYRKMNLPVPHSCPKCRHLARMKLRNPRKLYHRNCGNCGTGIETTYAPERPEKVLCEKCYEQALI
ncbi:MAG: hypothetical protein WCJ84_04855 [Candidatus Peregrinibacteria bacterium]